jgi:hypothetical protein
MRFVTTLESMPDKVTNQFDWTSLAEIWSGHDCAWYLLLKQIATMVEEHEELWANATLFSVQQYFAWEIKKDSLPECKEITLQVREHILGNPTYKTILDRYLESVLDVLYGLK